MPYITAKFIYLFIFVINIKNEEVKLKVVTTPENDGVSEKTTHVSHLSNEDIARCSRQLILPEFGVQGGLTLIRLS